MSDGEHVVIQWRASAEQPWQLGRTVPAWVTGQALSDQRRYVRENVRAYEFVPDGASVQTRVVPESAV